ncbi:TetR/AcrR family transcriptional regulator [Kineococcus rubinsiae]|uniref:TetR/AcrR family transcriptional regulator n=1 Tax=Kineococcus rubinsiae TaxID=2609562 RepID=UPI0014311981|nr:TetR/AcrR family transcriptional regulator [Kineococcus rubinsiae]NIZ90082.1 TetR/AcrR family transcriptional regulator [Kineococcus rubinsiae]
MTATTRRSEQRAATLAEIKAAAWADMARSGTTGLSLRGVAREMGMAVSALYRYFPSRDDLLTTLVVDCFDALTARLRTALDEVPAGADAVEAYLHVGRAYRDWALADPLQYRLAFGNPVDGYTGTDATTAAAQRSSGVLLEVMARAVDADRVDTATVDALLTDPLRAALEGWSAALPRPLPAAALGAAAICYAALHGAIDLELNRHLPPQLRGQPALFDATLRSTITALTR